MKIGLFGSDNTAINTMLILLADKGHDVVVLTDDDIERSNATKRLLIEDNPIYIRPVEEFDEYIELPKRNNEFRGGSRGKGGKTKYRRS